VPPDRRGLIHENDSASLIGFKQLKDENFKKDLCLAATITLSAGSNSKANRFLNDKNPATFLTIKDVEKENIQIHFTKPVKVNCVVLKEFITDGQSVQKFYLQVRNGEEFENYFHSTIGHKRIITFPAREAKDIFIYFKENKRAIKMADVEAYLIDERLVEEPGMKK